MKTGLQRLKEIRESHYIRGKRYSYLPLEPECKTDLEEFNKARSLIGLPILKAVIREIYNANIRKESKTL